MFKYNEKSYAFGLLLVIWFILLNQSQCYIDVSEPQTFAAKENSTSGKKHQHSLRLKKLTRLSFQNTSSIGPNYVFNTLFVCFYLKDPNCLMQVNKVWL